MNELKIGVLIALCILCVTGCSEKELNGGSYGIASDGMGYFSVNLNIPGSTGNRERATETGEDDERTVNNVVILLYDAGGPSSVLRYILEPDFSPSSGQLLVTGAKVVKYQDYQMIVLVNTNENLKGEFYPEEGISTLTDLNQVVEGKSVEKFCAVTSGPTPTPSFFMSNANGPVPVKKTQLKATSIQAEQDPVGVKVDRIVAKVQVVKGWEDQASTGNYEFADFKWTLGVTNRKTFLIRQYARFANGEMEDYETGSIADRKDIYATDPNFSEYHPSDFFRVDLNSSGNDFQTIHRPGEGAENQWVYAFENTMETIDNDYLDYTTHIVVRGTVIPNGLANGNGGSKDYYSFINTTGTAKIFTHEQAVLWKKEDNFPDEMGGLKEAIETAAGFDFSEGSTPPDSFRTSGTITHHKAGMNVYLIPVKHFGGNSSDYGCYGMVRNNVYKVTIKTISGPGTGGTGYIAVDMKINDWYIREQGEDI